MICLRMQTLHVLVVLNCLICEHKKTYVKDESNRLSVTGILSELPLCYSIVHHCNGPSSSYRSVDWIVF